MAGRLISGTVHGHIVRSKFKELWAKFKLTEYILRIEISVWKSICLLPLIFPCEKNYLKIRFIALGKVFKNKVKNYDILSNNSTFLLLNMDYFTKFILKCCVTMLILGNFYSSGRSVKMPLLVALLLLVISSLIAIANNGTWRWNYQHRKCSITRLSDRRTSYLQVHYSSN